MPRNNTPRNEQERAARAAATRVEHLNECYGPPHLWKFVRKGFDPLGKHTKSGYLVKHYAVLYCLAHPDEGEVIAGVAEAKSYGNVTVRRSHAGRPRKYRRDLA